MADSYTVKAGDSLQSISKQQGVSLQEMKQQNPELAARTPAYDVKPGDSLKVPPAQKPGDVNAVCNTCDCIIYDLAHPFLIALAKDGTIVKVTTVQSDDGPLDVGQDATHATGRTMPNGQVTVGSNEGSLKSTMNQLLTVFAGSDSDGKARKLFNKFQAKNSTVQTFTDPTLDKAIEANPNFKTFADRTLAALTTPPKPRIHQKLKDAGWDINKVKLIDDLGVPAFNSGNKSFAPIANTGDWANGLAVMINGVQYVFVHVMKYHYDSCKMQYEIELKFDLYDMFGLDDTDVIRYGVTSPIGSALMATNGISAWWQLQHQYNYAPVLVKGVVTKKWTVSTVGQ